MGGGGGEKGRGTGGKGEAGLSNSINNRPQPQSSTTTMVGGGEGGEGTTFSEQSPNNKTRNQPDKPDQPSHPLLAREKQGSCCTHHTTPGYTQHTTLLKVGAFGPDHNHLSSPSPRHTTLPHHNPRTHLIFSPVPSLLHPPGTPNNSPRTCGSLVVGVMIASSVFNSCFCHHPRCI